MGAQMPILAVIGINGQGKREGLAFTAGECENQPTWKDLLEQLQQRGRPTIGLWVLAVFAACQRRVCRLINLQRTRIAPKNGLAN
jgi:transposase-like protein